MRKVARTIAICAAMFISATPALADPRIRTVTYAPDRVIAVTGHYGFQVAIEFPEEDRIESVAIGDSTSWQATPNKRGDALFIKPVDIGEPTNMTVLTANRNYSFELTAKSRTEKTPPSEVTYLLRIVLPEPTKADDPGDLKEPPVSQIAARADVNTSYTYTGSRENLPSRVFDDGSSTTFEWPQGVETPAIFVRRPDGGEAIVNFSYVGTSLVVHQVAREFILRNGGEITRLFNDGFKEIERGPDAPQPRKEKGRGFLGLFNGSGP